MEIHQLIWNESKAAWICSYCGAVYKRPHAWKPPTNYCMKCKIVWK